jgi:hypothetical protein
MPATAAPPAFSPVPPQPPPRSASMDTHVKVIGALQVVFGVLAVTVALFVLVSGDFAAQQIEDEGNEPEVADMVRAILRIVAFLALAIGVVGIVGAIGLFTLKPWGRGLSLAFCGISLLNIPFGTALGIYGLVILTRPETAELFRHGPAGAAA